MGFIGGANVPFNVPLKITKRSISFVSKKEASFIFETRLYFTLFVIYCTSGGNRTHTVLLPLDFESSASTNSATEASGVGKNKQ